eukprot:251157_1
MGSGMSASEVREKVKTESDAVKTRIRQNDPTFFRCCTFSTTKSSLYIASNLMSQAFQTNSPLKYQQIAAKLQNFVDQGRANLDEQSQISHSDDFSNTNDIKFEAHYWLYSQNGDYLKPTNKNKLSICCVVGIWYNQKKIERKDEDEPSGSVEVLEQKELQAAMETLKTINDESSGTSRKLKHKNCQIVVNSCFNMTDYPQEVAGQLISNVEECVVLQGSNRLWVSQQIVHAVSRARVGLSPLERIARNNSASKVEGDGMDLEVEIYSFVYEKTGKKLD